MVKHIDAAGIPAVQIATVIPISISVGANRIVPGVSIPHPIGKPELLKEEEKAFGKKVLRKALEALTTEIFDQTVFKFE